MVPRLLRLLFAVLDRLSESPSAPYHTAILSRLSSIADSLPEALQNLMPFPELQDSISSVSNMLLQSLVDSLHANPRWGCRVISADKAGILVSLPTGTPVESAFGIATEIIASYPSLKLTVDRVFAPFLSAARGRYAGLEFRGPLAKPELCVEFGDGACPRCRFAQRILRGTIGRLFATGDLSEVKQYVEKEWGKIESSCDMREWVLYRQDWMALESKELRGVIREKESRRRKEEAAKYIVVMVAAASADTKVRDMMKPAEDALLHGERPNLRFYQRKLLLPLLNEALSVFGVNADHWLKPPDVSPGRKLACAGCDRASDSRVCKRCSTGESTAVLREKIERLRSEVTKSAEKCQNCAATLGFGEAGCGNLWCDSSLGIRVAMEDIKLLEGVIIKKRDGDA